MDTYSTAKTVDNKNVDEKYFEIHKLYTIIFRTIKYIYKQNCYYNGNSQ